MCDAGYENANQTDAASTVASLEDDESTTDIGCLLIPPPPPVVPGVNGWLVFVLVLLGVSLVGCAVCVWKRKSLKQWALWKFASARLYKR